MKPLSRPGLVAALLAMPLAAQDAERVLVDARPWAGKGPPRA